MTARGIEPGLLGVWSVDRRASTGDVRFERVSFYRDGRFGTVAIDHRTTVYGSWWVGAADDGAADLLSLRFDYSPSPSASYHVLFDTPLAGPCTLVDATAGQTRLRLERALPVEAALVGEWRGYAGALERGDVGLDGLELGRDARYLLHPAGVSPRAGRWGFDREPAAGPGSPIAGTLLLDPADTAHPRQRWHAEVPARGNRLLVLRPTPGGRAVVLHRLEPVMPVAALLGHWRLRPPGGPGAPDEVFFLRDGRLEALPRSGAARTHGRWSFLRTDPHATALRGVLSVSAFAVAGPARERWVVTLAFDPRADLSLTSEDGRHTLRYRRLFR